MRGFLSGLGIVGCVAIGFIGAASLALADRLGIDLKVGVNEITAEDTLPASQLQAADANPPCGRPPNTVEDIAKAVIGFGNISVGVPLLEASKYITIEPGLANALRALTGTLNGKASCEQVCVELPLNATNVDADGFVKAPQDSAWTKLEFFSEAPIGAALMEKPKFTKAANGYLICALAKNWKHDQDRVFRLKLTYDKK
jgi:hypothetical protein